MSQHALATPSSASRAAWRARLARLRAFARTEHGVVVLALGVVGLHIADDNYLQPAAGTSPADHLASGLIPLAILRPSRRSTRASERERARPRR